MDGIIWLLVVIALLMVEAGTVSLVSLWFAAGALAALIAGLFSAPLWLQLTLFLVVSCLSLACLTLGRSLGSVLALEMRREPLGLVVAGSEFCEP